jgi:AcrR family transcriptional regulator
VDRDLPRACGCGRGTRSSSPSSASPARLRLPPARHRTSISEIVAKTGIARTSLYRHLSPREPEPITAAARRGDMVGRAERMLVLRPHLEHGVPLARAAIDAGVPIRTARRWLAAYRAGGPALEPATRDDRG